MIHKTERIGNFTSSEIFKLMSNGKAKGSFGKPYYTYIIEKNMERRSGLSIENESHTKPLSWGKLVEPIPFELMDIGCVLTSEETLIHPEYNFWSGSPDVLNANTVKDIKCPLTRKSYFTMYDCDSIDEIREAHDDGEKYYWQIVSNSILANKSHGELFIYIPYKNELESIRAMAINSTGSDMQKYYWVANSSDNELPYLIEGKHYLNHKSFLFEIPAEDKKALTDRIIEAGKLLIELPNA